ncbi:MAG: L,D-transpeptidase family protein [Sphingomicrobium sp.]
MTLRTLFRGATVALLFSALPFAVASSAAAQGANMPAEAIVGTSAVYPTQGRYLLVDAASAQLFMVEDGQIRDTMKVIVGKPTSQTPTIASKIYYATLNPYWNVPADLAQKLIAPRVLAQGTKYLTSRHYQVLASFDDGAPEIAPESVDWKAVAEGRATVKVRQLPGPANSMGQVKFGFANAGGVFLHDSPEKELFESDQRQLSNGCVRLEDAPRLARWMLGRDPSEFGDQPEEHVLLPQAVPIYITYLNAPVNTAGADAPMSFVSASR